MSNTQGQHPQRDTWISIVLALVILGNLFMTAVYWTTVRQPGDSSLTLILLLLASAAGVAAGVGMWFWKRWGVYLYGISAIATAVIALVRTGDLVMVFGALLIPIIVLYILQPKYQYFD